MRSNQISSFMKNFNNKLATTPLLDNNRLFLNNTGKQTNSQRQPTNHAQMLHLVAQKDQEKNDNTTNYSLPSSTERYMKKINMTSY